MTIESASYLNDLNTSYPANADQMGEGDDHIRQLKSVLKNTFPGLAGSLFRAVIKAGSFTPAATENSCLFLTTSTVTCTLPALAGVVNGTYYLFKPLTSPLTINTYSGTEYLDSGTTTKVVAAEDWAIVIKVDSTRWALFSVSALTASAILTALGANAVQNATTAANATTHIARTDNPHTVTKAQVGLGNCDNTADSVKSVNYATTAGSAPANGGTASNSDMVDGYHANNLPYAPLTAVVAIADMDAGGSGYCTATRANGSTFQFKVDITGGGGGGG